MEQMSLTDMVQAITAAISVIVSIIGFAVLIQQVRQIERSIRSDTNTTIYNMNSDYLKILIENPELHPYFHDNKEITREDENYGKVMSLAEFMAEYLELIALHKQNIPKHVWLKWVNYIQDTYKNSPVIRQHFADYEDWYSKDIIEIIKDSALSPKPQATKQNTRHHSSAIQPGPRNTGTNTGGRVTKK